MAVHSRVIMQGPLSYIQYIIDIWCYFSKTNILYRVTKKSSQVTLKFKFQPIEKETFVRAYMCEQAYCQCVLGVCLPRP